MEVGKRKVESGKCRKVGNAAHHGSDVNECLCVRDAVGCHVRV